MKKIIGINRLNENIRGISGIRTKFVSFPSSLRSHLLLKKINEEKIKRRNIISISLKRAVLFVLYVLNLALKLAFSGRRRIIRDKKLHVIFS